ncbi:MAG: hypothetical protein US40_C0005G0008 [Candidatus Roizmanbacteria bacterium GW2011_GWC2_37_13]|uniref:Uncharacterized protein n=1 Tax=Candidatus Roizmanbacteria bacterium GW2011_GWC2_37_13 TaxID=1618486 RepID=A0A0G0G3Z1_9BACT|nr:MAG: hypothetical protein US38_C0005G0008 [Candidatus Roizmanbacteria bacterium GW2011_GWC1_37_12]KKQ25838.1 MAG: hypothetical protein US40_C0005G0008 [Candidatus Roizmanbacteria bacterium GW2011_GWC2_37_13]
MKYLTHHFKKEVKNHVFDYLLLITAGIFFLISINIFKGERFLEFIILLSFTSFYIIWGIYHHLIEDSLHLKIVIEYILIAFTILFLLKIIVFP